MPADDEYERSFKTNVFIAVFTTATARLKLYEALDTLQERVLCYNTDSVIYRWKPGQVDLPMGNFFGPIYRRTRWGPHRAVCKRRSQELRVPDP